jgi:hypothetical protein
MIWYSHGERVVPSLLRYSYYEGLLKVLIDKSAKTAKDILDNETFFYRNWFKNMLLSKWILAWFLETILFFCSPGFWIYALSFRALSDECETTRKAIMANREGSWKQIVDLTMTHLLPPADISWKDKGRLKDHFSALAKLDREIERAKRELTNDFMEGDFY